MGHSLILPEPLRIAAVGAARIMITGVSGTSGRGGSPCDYAGLAVANHAAMITLMRRTIETEAPPWTLIESGFGLPNGNVDETLGFIVRLIVCRADVQRVDPTGGIRYLLSAPRCQSVGLDVRRIP